MLQAKVDIKDYYVMTHGNNFFDRPVNIWK